MVRNCLPAVFMLTTVAPAVEFAHGTQPPEACLGLALERGRGCAVEVEFNETRTDHRLEFDIQGCDGPGGNVALKPWQTEFE